jgi:hypothetical protein
MQLSLLSGEEAATKLLEDFIGVDLELLDFIRLPLDAGFAVNLGPRQPGHWLPLMLPRKAAL